MISKRSPSIAVRSHMLSAPETDARLGPAADAGNPGSTTAVAASAAAIMIVRFMARGLPRNPARCMRSPSDRTSARQAAHDVLLLARLDHPQAARFALQRARACERGATRAQPVVLG